jgi:O-antigen/teichoic acid export membrane protein
MIATMIRRTETRLGESFAPLLRGMAAFGGAELAGRIVRLATTIVIARRLTPEIVGQAAFALTLFELIRVLERVGTGQQIVIAPEHELDAVCNTVRRIYVAWTGVLMLVQLTIALALAELFDKPVAGAMLAALSLVFVFMAGGHVQYFLAMRSGRVGALARISAVQTIADQALTLVLMLAWPSPWAIVLPKILAAPLWLVLALRAHPFRPVPQAGVLPMRRILASGLSILIADGLSALRTQGDNLIVGAVLGTTALGTYFFAFNAGLGIIGSLAGAFGSVAFPLLARTAAGADRQAALRRLRVLGLGLLVPLVLLQAIAAPFYVPLVFGARWVPAARLVSILCLGGVALVINQIVSAWHRANGNLRRDALNSLYGCVLALAGLTLGATTGSLQLAAAGLVCGGLAAALYSLASQLPA